MVPNVEGQAVIFSFGAKLGDLNYWTPGILFIYLNSILDHDNVLNLHE
jgi:hypothetical protein